MIDFIVKDVVDLVGVEGGFKFVTNYLFNID